MALNYKSSLIRYRQYLQNSQNAAVWQAGMFTALSLLLLIVLVAFALRPTLSTIAGLFGQIREQEALNKQLASKALAVQQATTMLQQSQDRLGILEQALPTEAKWSDFVMSLESNAKLAGVSVERLAVDGVQIVGAPVVLKTVAGQVPQKPILPPDVTAVPFNVSAKGTFSQLRQFAESLEKSRRVTVLSDVSINKEKDGTLTGTFVGVIGYAAQLILP